MVAGSRGAPDKPPMIENHLFDGDRRGFVNASRTRLAEAHGSSNAFTAARSDWLELQDASYEACRGDAITLRAWDFAPAPAARPRADRDHRGWDAEPAPHAEGPTIQGLRHNYLLAEHLLRPLAP